MTGTVTFRSATILKMSVRGWTENAGVDLVAVVQALQGVDLVAGAQGSIPEVTMG